MASIASQQSEMPSSRGQRQAMGQILLQEGIITEEQLEGALKKQREDPRRPLGSVLAEMGLASQAQIEAALKRHRTKQRNLMGKALVDQGVISQDQLASALEEQGRSPGKRLGAILEARGYATSAQIDKALSRAERPPDPMKRLLAVIGVLLVVAVAVLFWPTGGEEGDGDEGAAAGAQTTAGQDQTSPPPTGGPFRQQASRGEEALETINEYKQELPENPSTTEDAQTILRIANLYYSSVRNFDEAVKYYELLLYEFPDWEDTREIYPNLANAYEQLGKQELARSTYQRMLDIFPEDSQEYLFAQEKLGR